MARNFKTNVIELKKLMVEHGLEKTTDLSEASGVDRNTLAKVLSGEIQPSSMVMDKLAYTLKMNSKTAGEIFFTPTLRDA